MVYDENPLPKGFIMKRFFKFLAIFYAGVTVGEILTFWRLHPRSVSLKSVTTEYFKQTYVDAFKTGVNLANAEPWEREATMKVLWFPRQTQ